MTPDELARGLALVRSGTGHADGLRLILLVGFVSLLRTSELMAGTRLVWLLPAVLLVRELVLFLTMWRLGCADRDLFLLRPPAAWLPRREFGLAPSSRAAMALVGPASGALVGLALAAVGTELVNQDAWSLAQIFILYALAQLLPLAVTDGSYVIENVLLARRPGAVLLLKVLMAVVLIALGVVESSLLLDCGIVLLLLAPMSYRPGRTANDLRARAVPTLVIGGECPEPTSAQIQTVYEAALAASPSKIRVRGRERAAAQLAREALKRGMDGEIERGPLSAVSLVYALLVVVCAAAPAVRGFLVLKRNHLAQHGELGLLRETYPAATDSHNVVRLGAQAPAALEIPVEPFRELDGMTRDALIGARRAAAARHPELFAAAYEPTPAIFSGIEDGAPWWGMSGFLYYHHGNRSIDGVSARSREIFNPFYLVTPEFLTMAFPASRWKPGTDVALARPDFPLAPTAEPVVWDARERRARVKIHLSSFVERINAYLVAPTAATKLWFSFDPVNARDLGFASFRPRAAGTVGVEAERATPDLPVPNLKYYHRGGSCNYPGGCNNLSPYQAEMDSFWVSALPATLAIDLFVEKTPAADAKADMTFFLDFD